MGGDRRAGNAEDTCPSNSLCRSLCMVLATVEQVGPCTASMEWGSVQWKLHPACHLFHFDFGFWNSSHSDYGMFVCVCVWGGDV